jgi:CPA2 family monovalent cation:H+ antiporter-2
MPHAMQTYVSLYGSWLQNLRVPSKDRMKKTPVRRIGGLLLLDVSVIAAIVINVAGARREVTAALAQRGMSGAVAQVLLLAAGLVVTTPFVVGAVRLARSLGAALAADALPTAAGGVDLAAAPRRGLVVGLQMTILMLVGIPLLAAIQPFVPLIPLVSVVGVALVLIALSLWRTATNLEAHARAGAQVITELLAAEARSPDHGAHALHDARHLIPGLGEPEIVELPATSPAVGKTLKTLNLRGLTGATVVALQPSGGAPAMPTGDETLAVGDVVVLAGSSEAVRTARAMLGAS